jgi:hypothetical protein
LPDWRSPHGAISKQANHGSEAARGDNSQPHEDGAMKDFWLSSGYMLLDKSEHGGLILTGDFIRAYLARPELMPPSEACPAERALHAALMAEPLAKVEPCRVAAIADEDARENWEAMLGFRDQLQAAPTIEAAYCKLIGSGAERLPPLFLDQLVHVIMRNALDGVDDPFLVRAGEIFFRPQRVAVENGRLMLADAEAIERHEHKVHSSPLLAMFAGETADMDVLTKESAPGYWDRSDAFDTILDLGGLDGGRRAIASALTLWARRILDLDLDISPIERIEDGDVRWIMGLDAEATKISNALWHGVPIEQEAQNRILAIFAAIPKVPAVFQESVGDRPLYFLLAMDENRILRMKPQNLVTGLPLRERALAQ